MRYTHFTEMPVWKIAFDLLLEIYQATKSFPVEERFGLTSDIRRSANSIVHNIAEGFGRFAPKEKTYFYRVSRGSTYELWSQTLASFALGYIKEDIRNRWLKSCQQIIDNLDALMKTVDS